MSFLQIWVLKSDEGERLSYEYFRSVSSFMPAVYRCLMRLMVIFLKAPAPRWGGRGDD